MQCDYKLPALSLTGDAPGNAAPPRADDARLADARPARPLRGPAPLHDVESSRGPCTSSRGAHAGNSVADASSRRTRSRGARAGNSDADALAVRFCAQTKDGTGANRMLASCVEINQRMARARIRSSVGHAANVRACYPGENALQGAATTRPVVDFKPRYPPAPPPPLHVACERGRVEDARRLIDEGAGVDSLGARGSTPLLIACERGRRHGPRPRPPFRPPRRTIHVPAAAAPRLVSADYPRPGRGGAATRLDGLSPQVELLLDRGADGHRAKANGAQPLHVAVAAGHVDAAALLLDRVEVDRANLFGWTALYVACKNGRVDAARLCLDLCGN